MAVAPTGSPDPRLISWQFPRVAMKPTYIHDRARYATLTSVRFVADDRVVVGHFRGMRLYLVAFTRGCGDFEILSEVPSIVASGESVFTDLLDFDGIDTIAASNFRQGTQSLYRVAGDTISFERELPRRGVVTQCHGVRFVGSDAIAATYNSRDARWRILDRQSGEIRFEQLCSSRPQDVLPLPDGRILVAGRTDHISGHGRAREEMKAVLTVYRPDGAGWVSAGEWSGHGHLDQLAWHGGLIYGTNQYADRIDVFRVEEDDRIQHVRCIEGFSFPHGLDIRGGLLAVSNYGDSTIKVLELGSEPMAGGNHVTSP